MSGIFFVLSGKFSYYLDSFHIDWKVSGLSGNFPDCLECFRIVRKGVLLSGKFPYYLASSHIVWKVFGLSGTFPDCPESGFYCLESFRIVRKVSTVSGIFLDWLEHLEHLLSSKSLLLS